MQTGLQPSPSVAAPKPWPSVDRRLHRRHGPDRIILTFLGADHPVINWSQGGALVVDSHPELPIGATISGVLSLRGQSGLYRFSAKLLRRNERTHEIALRFDRLAPAVSEMLTRAVEPA